MIRKINKNDRDIYIAMASEFYSSDVVLHSIPAENLSLTFDELMRSDMYTECYMLESDGAVCGYALLSKTFSQEAGGMVIWLEELYVRPQFRSNGLGTEFFSWLFENKDSCVKRIRLEIEPENIGAVSLYKRLGFKFFEYSQMIIEF